MIRIRNNGIWWLRIVLEHWIGLKGCIKLGHSIRIIEKRICIFINNLLIYITLHWDFIFNVNLNIFWLYFLKNHDWTLPLVFRTWKTFRFFFIYLLWFTQDFPFNLCITPHFYPNSRLFGFVFLFVSFIEFIDLLYHGS